MEVWKDIPGHEGRYQVSDLGRVRSLDRMIEYPAHVTSSGLRRGGYARKLQGRVLRPGRFTHTGHVSVVLGHGAHGSPVHRLVLAAFIGPPPPDHEVLHLNHVASDNRLCNLRYGTRSENVKMDYERGIPRKRKMQ